MDLRAIGTGPSLLIAIALCSRRGRVGAHALNRPAEQHFKDGSRSKSRSFAMHDRGNSGGDELVRDVYRTGQVRKGQDRSGQDSGCSLSAACSL